MSKIEELIQEYCPDGVEYVEIGKICETVTPSVKVKSSDYLSEGLYPVIDQGKDLIGGYTNEIGCFPNGEYVIFGDHTCAVKYVNFPFVQGADGVKVLKAHDDIIPRYLYHCMTAIFLDSEYKRHWSIMRQREIPLPALPVQREIVHILDSFTALQDELQKELEERKKQFEHVRDQLMNNGSDVILSDVAEYSKGRVSASEMTTENYVGVDNLLQNKAGKVSATFVPAKGNVIRFERNDILIGNIRPYLKKIWLADTNGGTNGDVLCIHVLDSSSVNPRYLYFVLSSDAFFAYDTVNVRSSGKMPRGDKESVMKYSFTLPSLQEQNDIVRKLESMSEYIYDAIPEELSLRQQQYTYYRDKLLSFPRKEA